MTGFRWQILLLNLIQIVHALKESKSKPHEKKDNTPNNHPPSLSSSFPSDYLLPDFGNDTNYILTEEEIPKFHHMHIFRERTVEPKKGDTKDNAVDTMYDYSTAFSDTVWYDMADLHPPPPLVRCFSCFYSLRFHGEYGSPNCKDPFIAYGIPEIECRGRCSTTKVHLVDGQYIIARGCMERCKNIYDTSCTVQCCYTHKCNGATSTIIKQYPTTWILQYLILVSSLLSILNVLWLLIVQLFLCELLFCDICIYLPH